MATGGLGESSYQVHGDEFHGHTSMSEIFLHVSSFVYSDTYLTVFAVHEDIFLHSFPVVQLFKRWIAPSESDRLGFTGPTYFVG